MSYESEPKMRYSRPETRTSDRRAEPALHEPDELETDFEGALQRIADAVTDHLLRIKAVVGDRVIDPPWECLICGQASASLSGIMLHSSRHVANDETEPYPEDDFRRRIPAMIAANRAEHSDD